MILLSHMLKKAFRHDIADALTGSTPARIIPVFFQIVGVIEGNLLSGTNIPDAATIQIRSSSHWMAQFGVATVVDVTGQIAFRFSVEVSMLLSLKMYDCRRRIAAAFLAVDLFTDVLDHLSAFQNRPSCEQAGAVYPGGLTDRLLLVILI